MVCSNVIQHLIDFVTFYAWTSEATRKICYKIGETNTPYVDLDQPAITLGPGNFRSKGN